jgi:hypothetical protein
VNVAVNDVSFRRYGVLVGTVVMSRTVKAPAGSPQPPYPSLIRRAGPSGLLSGDTVYVPTASGGGSSPADQKVAVQPSGVVIPTWAGDPYCS